MEVSSQPLYSLKLLKHQVVMVHGCKVPCFLNLNYSREDWLALTLVTLIHNKAVPATTGQETGW